LHSVKYRQQTVPIDGLYAILGLLPYGKDVKVNYKDKLCLDCKIKEEDYYKKNKKAIICQHLENKKTE